MEIELPTPARYQMDLTVQTVVDSENRGFGGVRGLLLDADTGEAISGASVSMSDGAGEILTGEDGAFRFDNVGAGRRTVIVHHIRYGESEAAVAVRESEVTMLRLEVSARPLAVEPLEITVIGRRLQALDTRGFYEREAWGEATGRGHFFTVEDVERRNPRLISQLIADVPGTVLDCSNRPGSRTCELRFSGAGCLANVYIDGTPVVRSDNQRAPVGVDQLISPHEIAAIEVYPSAASLPAEFGGSTGGCGAIAIWSK
ncbi:MAG: Plug and carboxypeptidase regulatory-like domain-containing protein [Gemmatimonadetes bacterium]|nr:Plug and carboxypeptidase regulatory-like domain-containing protein [Gemmatimonadota bacterium]